MLAHFFILNRMEVCQLFLNNGFWESGILMAEQSVQTPATIELAPLRARRFYESSKWEEAIAGYLFMTPALLIFTFFLIIPVLLALYLSFTNWNGITPLRQENAFDWVSADNYEHLLMEEGT